MPLKTHLEEPPGLNLTPMIDVVFLLIIFFMVATEFTQFERRIALEVPEVAQASALTPAPRKRVISVYRDGSLSMDGKTVALEQLAGELSAARSQYADLAVMVRGDADSRHQRIAEVLAACKQAGIGHLGISVRMARGAADAVER